MWYDLEMHYRIPKEVSTVSDGLRKAGHETYLQQEERAQKTVKKAISLLTRRSEDKGGDIEAGDLKLLHHEHMQHLP